MTVPVEALFWGFALRVKVPTVIDVSEIVKAIEVVLGKPLDTIQRQSVGKYLERTGTLVIVDAIRVALPGWAADEPDWYLSFVEGWVVALISPPATSPAPRTVEDRRHGGARNGEQ